MKVSYPGIEVGVQLLAVDVLHRSFAVARHHCDWLRSICAGNLKRPFLIAKGLPFEINTQADLKLMP